MNTEQASEIFLRIINFWMKRYMKLLIIRCKQKQLPDTKCIYENMIKVEVCDMAVETLEERIKTQRQNWKQKV